MNNSSVDSQIHSAFLASSNLTQNQLLLWTGQQLDPKAPLYNDVLVFTLEGEIAPDTFQRAFQKLVDRSDALRTVIEVIGGVPQQRVVAHLPYLVEFIDFSGTPGPEQAFRDWLEQRKVRQHDLGTRSFDSALIKLAPARFKWTFSQHHILTDGWSEALVFEQMAHFYQLAREKRLHEAPELNAYQAYVEYEREFRQTESYRQVQSYWRDKLLRPVDSFDFFGRQLSGRSYRVHLVDHRLGEERTQLLKTRAQEAGVRLLSQDLTLYTVFLTVLFAYLHRISGQSRLRISSPFHNRPSPAFKETMGLFIEMGVLQVDVLPNDTFASLLKKVQSEVLASFRYAQPGISSAEHNRVGNVLLNYSYATFVDFCGLPAQAEWVHSGFGDRNQGLGLHISDFDQANNILLQFEFNEEVFEPAQQGRVVEHLINLLDAFLRDRDQAIGQVDILSAKERQAIQSFSQGSEATPAHHTIVELFEAQVEQTPNAPAMVFEDQQLTYRQLNGRANQLARHLRALGVGPETRVGLYVDRSLDMVVGLLGILKAGGAYLPLDHTYPAERTAFAIQDAGVPVLVTKARFEPDLSAHPARLVRLDADWDTISAESEENLHSEVTWTKRPLDNLAYLMYTSGSTGKPKGVMVCHGNVVNFCTGMDAVLPHDPPGVWLAVTSLSFDISVLEVLWTLSRGFKVVVYADKMREEAGAEDYSIPAQIERHHVTHFQCTPSMASMLLIDDRTRAALRSVETFLVGGETLPAALAAQLTQIVQGRVLNMYGPTETTVWSCTYAVDGQQNTVPIGRPIANTEIYIVDQNLQPVPVGVVGELLIGGDGVARGYLNRPELTAERFIQHPFSDRPKARLYRTGDLARYRQDGNIEFLGRSDHQVKIRGHRIELGEIEANLTSHPAIRESVLVAHTQNADPTLVAYVVTDRDTLPATDELRAYLRQRLPDYMLPASFIFMEKMPLTPNGKIDRKALPEPDTSRPTLTQSYATPETETEQLVATIWQEVLGLDKVGRHDNFFDLGGDSISVMKVMMQVSQILKTELAPKALFEMPTLADFAVRVEDSLIAEIENLSDEEAELLLAKLD